jgi:vacuolar-type H+-ATPase subunit H
MSMQSTQGKSDQMDAAGEVKGHAKDRADDVAQNAKTEARGVASDAKDQAADVLHKSREELRERASDQTKTLSSTLGDLAGQLDTMADGSDDPKAQVAQLAKSAAGQLQKSADRLDDGGFDGLVDDMKRFARNRPGAFLLGAVATGFAVGRLAKHADLQQAGEQAKQAASPADAAGGDATASKQGLGSTQGGPSSLGGTMTSGQTQGTGGQR